MSSAGHSYLDEAVRLLDRGPRRPGTGDPRRRRRSSLDAVSAGGLVHVFGTGHSHLLAEELFYRAGGLAQINPILVDALDAPRRCRAQHPPRAAVRSRRCAARRRADRAARRDDRRFELRRKRHLRRDGGQAPRAEGCPTIGVTSIRHATAAGGSATRRAAPARGRRRRPRQPWSAR